MPIPTYTPGYPPDGSSLGQTKSTIRNNLDGTFQTLAIDHIDNNGQPGSQPAGYHKSIHMVPQGTFTSTPNYGQLYCKTVTAYSTDQALFWTSGAGRTAQMTVPITLALGTNGTTFLPGGLLLQWGTGSGIVTFPRAFAGSVAFPTPIVTFSPTGVSTSGVVPIVKNITLSGFEVTIASGFTWMAIGA